MSPASPRRAAGSSGVSDVSAAWGSERAFSPHEHRKLGRGEVDDGDEIWEYAVLVTSLGSEILSIGQLYRDRADCENVFDELKNQWGWGGFTTRDLKRCRLTAGMVALFFNWWNPFVRLADPNHHREAITSRPLLLQAIGRQTRPAGRTTVTITSSHGEHPRAQKALTRIARFFLNCERLRSS